MYSGPHLVDESLSALVDEQLNAEEARSARAHLESCSACQLRLDELRSVVALLRALPDVLPQRDFRLGPRVVADPPNVVRLRRWYTVTRAAAAALAAVFVFLSVGSLYVDSQPAASPITLAAKPQLLSVPTAASQSAPTSSSATKSAAPAPAAAVRQAAPGAQGADSDQVEAATNVRPLPTPVPTPSPTAPPLPPPRPVTSSELDTAAPLRTAAAIAGVLAALTLLVTVLVRHRLQSASAHSL